MDVFRVSHTSHSWAEESYPSTSCMLGGPAFTHMVLLLTLIKPFTNWHINGFYFSEPRCAVALVSDGRTGPPDLERGSPSCPPPTNDNPPADRGGADSETESDTDDP